MLRGGSSIGEGEGVGLRMVFACGSLVTCTWDEGPVMLLEYPGIGHGVSRPASLETGVTGRTRHPCCSTRSSSGRYCAQRASLPVFVLQVGTDLA